MVPFKPHTATVRVPESAGEVPSQVSPATSRGMLQPMAPGAAFERFGVEETNPHLWICETSDADFYQVGGELEISGCRYLIRAIADWSQGLAADHLDVMLARIPL